MLAPKSTPFNVSSLPNLNSFKVVEEPSPSSPILLNLFFPLKPHPTIGAAPHCNCAPPEGDLPTTCTGPSLHVVLSVNSSVFPLIRAAVTFAPFPCKDNPG